MPVSVLCYHTLRALHNYLHTVIVMLWSILLMMLKCVHSIGRRRRGEGGGGGAGGGGGGRGEFDLSWLVCFVLFLKILFKIVNIFKTIDKTKKREGTCGSRFCCLQKSLDAYI